MERNTKQIGLVNLLVMFVIAIAAFGLARYANTLSGQVGCVFLGLGVLVLAVSYFQMRLEDTERLEKLEFDELTRTKSSASLFNATDAEVFPARRAREQFERFFVPGFTTLVFLLQATGAYYCWQWLKNPAAIGLNKAALAMSVFALFALALFLLGKYSAGIARLENNRLLRPGASYLLLGAYISFIVAASIAGVELGFPQFDLWAARALGVLLAFVAIETLISLVLEIYRPRTRTVAPRVLYDSRFIGLISQPEGIFTTAAHALDYQFGFKVSETWVYRYLEKAFAWLLLLQVGALALSTCFVFIAPGEQGLIERWGAAVEGRGVLNPGLHLKWPFPMDRVYRARTDQVQQFVVGSEQKEKAEGERERVIVWTVPHDKEPFNLLVASRVPQTAGQKSDEGAPVDLLTVGIPVQFRIKDIKAWTYLYVDAGALLEKIATREVVRYFVSVDLFDLMSSAREKAARDLRKNIQERADALSLGVEIVFVGLQDIHPPMGKARVEVAKKFEEVIGTRQEVEARILQAQAYALTNRAWAEAQKNKLVQEAEAYKIHKVAASAAQASQFTNQLVAYKASPQVFTERAYLQALARGATNARKYVLATTNKQDIIQLNLEDKVRQDLLDVPLPTKK